jgi:hypothetical protein
MIAFAYGLSCEDSFYGERGLLLGREFFPSSLRVTEADRDAATSPPGPAVSLSPATQPVPDVVTAVEAKANLSSRLASLSNVGEISND